MLVPALGFLVGLILGSFVECISQRSLGKSSFWSRSSCDSCSKKLAWYDLIPILSYFLLGGKCRYCHKKIPSRTVVVELMMGVLVAIFFWKEIPAGFFEFNFDNLIIFWPEVLFKLYFISILVILVLTDLREGLIPDRISITAIKTSIIFLFAWTIAQIGYLYYSLNSSPLGKILISQTDYLQRHSFYTAQPFIGDLVAALLAGLFFGVLIFATRGRGMGGGDLKMGIFIGLGLGFPLILLGLFLSFIFGSVAGIALILTRVKNLKQTIPFGPFLALGSIVAILFGNEIIDWYFKLKLL